MFVGSAMDLTDLHNPGRNHESLIERLAREFPDSLMADIEAVVKAVADHLPHACPETLFATSREWLEPD